VLKFLKVRLYPSQEQEILMYKTAGCCRFVYNFFLAHAKEHKDFNYNEYCKKLTALKKDEKYSFLQEVPSQPLQQSLKHLDVSFKRFFKKQSSFPVFKKKFVKDRFTYPEGVRLNPSFTKIFLPKIGNMKFKTSKKYLKLLKTHEFRTCTAMVEAGKWYISILVEDNTVPQPAVKINKTVGIDLGVKKYLVMSTGQSISAPDIINKLKEIDSLKSYLSRKKKGSNASKKLQLKIQTNQKHFNDLKTDFLNKLVDYIIKNHDCVILEDLNIRKMIKHKGDWKSTFNRLMTMIPMYAFRRKLQYKAMLAGKYCVAVNPAYTSRTCSSCEHVDKMNRKSQSEFECTRCGFSANADLNAAFNIHNLGLNALIAAGHAVKSAQITASELVKANLSAVSPSSFGFSAKRNHSSLWRGGSQNKNFANYIFWRLTKTPVLVVKLDTKENEIIIGCNEDGYQVFSPSAAAPITRDFKQVKELVKEEKLKPNKPEIHKALKLAKQIVSKSDGKVYLTLFDDEDFVDIHFTHKADKSGNIFRIMVYEDRFLLRYTYEEKYSFVEIKTYKEIFLYVHLMVNKQEIISFDKFKKQLGAVLDNMPVGQFSITPTSFYVQPYIEGTDVRQILVSFGRNNNAFITSNFYYGAKILPDSQLNKAFSKVEGIFKEQNENKKVFLKALPILEEAISIYKHLIGKIKVYFSQQEYNKNGFVQIAIYPLANSDEEAFTLRFNANGIIDITNDGASISELHHELLNSHFRLYKKGVTN
jgi:putative transposase